MPLYRVWWIKFITQIIFTKYSSVNVVYLKIMRSEEHPTEWSLVSLGKEQS